MRCLNDTVGLERGSVLCRVGQCSSLHECVNEMIMLIIVTHPREDLSFLGKIECFHQP